MLASLLVVSGIIFEPSTAGAGMTGSQAIAIPVSTEKAVYLSLDDDDPETAPVELEVPQVSDLQVVLSWEYSGPVAIGPAACPGGIGTAVSVGGSLDGYLRTTLTASWSEQTASQDANGEEPDLQNESKSIFLSSSDEDEGPYKVLRASLCVS